MHEFHKKHCPHYIGLAILVIVMLVSGWFAFGGAERMAPPTLPLEKSSQISISQTASQADANNGRADNQIPAPTAPSNAIAEQDADANGISVRIGAEEAYTLPYQESENVFEALSRLAEGGAFTFESKDFGPGLGQFITGINGRNNDTKKRYYWIYYINGNKATIGISAYILKPHDIITWNYEKEE